MFIRMACRWGGIGILIVYGPSFIKAILCCNSRISLFLNSVLVFAAVYPGPGFPTFNCVIMGNVELRVDFLMVDGGAF